MRRSCRLRNRCCGGLSSAIQRRHVRSITDDWKRVRLFTAIQSSRVQSLPLIDARDPSAGDSRHRPFFCYEDGAKYASAPSKVFAPGEPET
jgi:hypothetical protein